MDSESLDEHHRSIKQSLKNIVRNPATQETIINVVHACHRITVHALRFLKLYLLAYYGRGDKLPVVDKDLVVSIMNVLCEENGAQGNER